MNLITHKRIKARDISNWLRKEIIQKKVEPGRILRSSREICEKFNVSMVTADRAVNRLVKEGLVYRVRGSGTFVRGKKETRKLIIGYADIELERNGPGSYAAQGIFMDSCFSEFMKHNCELKYLSYYNDFIDMGKNPDLLNSLDGLILSSFFVDDATLKILENFHGVLTIYRFEYIKDINCNQIIPEMSNGFDEMFRHIKKEGIKKILIIKAKHVNACARSNEFKKAAIKHNFPGGDIDEVSIEVNNNDSGILAGYRIGSKILPDIEDKLIFCTSDFISFGIIDYMKKHDLSPGKEFQLVSFDNLEESGIPNCGEPMLTTINLPRKEIAEKAVEHTIWALQNKESYKHIIKVPTKLVVRQTAFNNKN